MRRFLQTCSTWHWCSKAALAILVTLSIDPAWSQAPVDIEAPPIEYSKTAGQNPVSRLMQQLQAGDAKLQYEEERGYLLSLLEQLDVPVASQVLVFSKTSLQFQYISHRNPRAIYFNDDVYVGWVRGSSLVEISTSDPHLGAAFYTLEMKPWRPLFRRENYDCLACHTTTMTRGVPGHTLRSVAPRMDGSIDIQQPSFVTDPTSSFAERWGGWFVTGQHGAMGHLGNAVLRGDKLDQRDSLNVRDLSRWLDIEDWPAASSDIVALMVLAHQTQMHNVLTQADFLTRKWLYDRELAVPGDQVAEADGTAEETRLAIEQAAQRVVQHLLFCNEAPLTSPVVGSAEFAESFASRGRRDTEGRSLRDLDLQQRLFKYPCSYLIHSPAFDALQPVLRAAIYRQLLAILNADSPAAEYLHLDRQTRTAILEILRDTKPGFAAVAESEMLQPSGAEISGGDED